MKKLSRQDLQDILLGCTILGTGGGGSLEKGLLLVDKAFDAGREFVLADLDEIPDDALVGTPYMCGSVSPDTPKVEAGYQDLQMLVKEPALRAFEVMEEYLGKKFFGVISTELGGGNTAIAFYVGAMLGKYILDADPAGRSVPELQHSLYYINGLPIQPITVVNKFGDVAIVKEVASDARAEALIRAMAVASENSVGVVDHPAKVGDIRNAVIPGAISHALEIGRVFREAKLTCKDLAAELVKAGGGCMLFRGRVKDYKWDTVGGFTVGDVCFEGEGEYAGSTYKIWYKNEHIISWKDGRIDVTVPDLICIINEESREPLTNPNYKTRLKVSVFGLPAPKEWRSKEGIEIFGPGHFGHDMEYTPIEYKYRLGS
jgi:hypothetical protein